MLRSAVIHRLAPPAANDPNSDPLKLRELALWFRQQADRAGSPHVWDARLRTAEDLEARAEKLAPAARVQQLLKPAA